MSGAVVVGDGGFARLDLAAVSRVASGQTGRIDTSRAGELAVGLVGGLVLLGGLAIARRRWRASSTGH
jgi:hypothetical protein